MCNVVSPPFAEALVRANLPESAIRRRRPLDATPHHRGGYFPPTNSAITATINATMETANDAIVIRIDAVATILE